MTSSRTEQLLRRLWAPDEQTRARPEVFTILDGARDPRIHSLARRSKLDHRCLYEGKLAPELARAAPYLVHLAARSPFTAQLIELGWGNSWGIFLRSRAILQELHRHFREFLLVTDDTGKTVFFRYYDPRVLRVYLPTCNREELRQVFGPVDCFCMEGDDGATLVEQSFGPQGFAEKVVPLEP